MLFSSALLTASCLLNYLILPTNPLFSTTLITLTQDLSLGNQLTCQNLDIELKSLAGAGGTGRVYQGTARALSKSIVYESVAVKVSLPTTKPRLQNECEILHHLEQKRVNHVDKCISTCSLVPNNNLGDFATVLYPFKSPTNANSFIVSSIAIIPSPEVAKTAACQLLQTVIEIILAGVVVTDLQFLADTMTGDVLLIDFTEARMIATGNLQYIDKQAIQSFLSEAIAFIPEVMKEEVYSSSQESVNKVQSMFPFLQVLFET